MKDFDIRKSGISGKGLFALRDYKIGEIIIDWKDCLEIINEEKYNNLTIEEKEYVQIINGVYRYFLTSARYMNYSCYNNTEPREIGDFVIRDIKVGEEITTNYYLEDGEMDFDCNCPKCS